jgi:hypothetical protein
MAKRTKTTPPAASSAGPSQELKHRLLFVLGAIVVFRIGSFIPVPGINSAVLAELFEQQSGTILDMFDMFSGGALSRFSLFAIGVMPYISASIIMQLLSHVEPRLKELRKEGEQGRRTITRWTRYATVALATFQAYGVAIALEAQSAGGSGVVLDPGWGFRITTVATLVTGTVFLRWLGRWDCGGLAVGNWRHLRACPDRGNSCVAGGGTSCPGGICDRICGLCRARSAKDHGQLCQTPGRAKDVWRSDLSFAVEIEYGRGDPAYFCLQYYFVPRDHRRLVR